MSSRFLSWNEGLLIELCVWELQATGWLCALSAAVQCHIEGNVVARRPGWSLRVKWCHGACSASACRPSLNPVLWEPGDMVPDLTEHKQIVTDHLSQQAKTSQISPILAMLAAENVNMRQGKSMIQCEKDIWCGIFWLASEQPTRTLKQPYSNVLEIASEHYKTMCCNALANTLALQQWLLYRQSSLTFSPDNVKI